jgi:serine/threonine protein kinase
MSYYDLRQSNILISKDGHACLGDFGSARVDEVHTIFMSSCYILLTIHIRELSPGPLLIGVHDGLPQSS